MNRIVGCFCFAAFALGACSRAPDIASPYANPEADLPSGFLAAVRIDLGLSPLARVLEIETGDPAVLHLFVLDAEVAGGDQAAVLSGPGAAELETVLVERGLLSQSTKNGSYRLGSDPNDDTAETALSSGPSGVAMGLLASDRLRRFDVDGRIVFAPTVDVRADLLSMDLAATAEVGGSAEVAVALNGGRLSRVLRRRFRDSLGPFGQMAMNQASQNRGVAQAGSAFDAAFDLLAGIRFLQSTYGRDGATARLRIWNESVVAGFVSALRPIDGAWPLVDEGGLKFAFACDPTALVIAIKRLGVRRGNPIVVRLPAWWDGRIAASFALDRMEPTRVAMGVVPETEPRAEDLDSLPLVVADSFAGAVAADGWFMRPAQAVRYGSLEAPPGAFALIRDGKIPVERAREILRVTRVSEDLLTVTWSGLQAP